MALYPNKFETQFRLQPGGNGEIFVADQPGYRDGAPRINRTQNRLNVTPHEALSQKYIMDTRLPALFKYGYAVGYNNMVAPKGRIVAGDPKRDAVDWTSDKMFNTLTLANGGMPVRLRETTDMYPSVASIVSTEGLGARVHAVGLDWAPADGNTLADAYADGVYRSCKVSSAAALTAGGYTIDAETGNVAKDGAVVTTVRPGNVPLGMLERNEYTRFENDSMDGKQPGPIITDAIVELPLFAFKDKAEENPWGSIYGNVAIGDLVKSDENGRVTISPLSSDVVDSMSAAEMERERQQVIGQVIGVNHDMVPEGGYKYAQWALEDRMRFEGFAPDMYTQNNRPGEDVVNSSAYQSTGRYPGYPYDRAYTEHDLQMLGSTTGRGYNKFLQDEYQLDNGIPGLTDGANVVVNNRENNNAAIIYGRTDTTQDYVKHFIKIAPNGNIEDGSLQVQLVDSTGTEVLPFTAVDSSMTLPLALGSTPFQVEYYNAVQGMLVISVADAAAADTLLATNSIIVNLKYDKRGLAGVPTFMDWDGCVGSAKILLQR